MRQAQLRRMQEAGRKAALELLELYQRASKEGVDARMAIRINKLRRQIGLPDEYRQDTIHLLRVSRARIKPDGTLSREGKRSRIRMRIAADAATIAALLAVSTILPAQQDQQAMPAPARQAAIDALRRARAVLTAQRDIADAEGRRKIELTIIRIDEALRELE